MKGFKDIATHSPIILAYPDAQILDFDTKSRVRRQTEGLQHR
ncbi:hypothetical protein DSBG_2392 [Desulfosporosinus sp. BG]|nr:hypothetical protein DSBG_2392 [Desulfosporosinus sp. BG]